MSQLSLEGKTVAVLRPEGQAGELARQIAKLGGKSYLAPTLEIRPTRDKRQVRDFICELAKGRIDYVVFTSRNGVRGLIEASEDLQLKNQLLKALNQATVVTIGPKTGAELERHGVQAMLTPSSYSSEGIVEILRGTDLKGRVIAIPRSRGANPYLPRALRRMGARVLEVPVYEVAPPSSDSRVLTLLRDLFGGKIDVVTFTSPSSAKNLFKIAERHGLADKLRMHLNDRVIVAAIGPVTGRSLNELGVKVDATPKRYVAEAMLASVLERLSEEGR